MGYGELPRAITIKLNPKLVRSPAWNPALSPDLDLALEKRSGSRIQSPEEMLFTNQKLGIFPYFPIFSHIFPYFPIFSLCSPSLLPVFSQWCSHGFRSRKNTVVSLRFDVWGTGHRGLEDLHDVSAHGASFHHHHHPPLEGRVENESKTSPTKTPWCTLLAERNEWWKFDG